MISGFKLIKLRFVFVLSVVWVSHFFLHGQLTTPLISRMLSDDNSWGGRVEASQWLVRLVFHLSPLAFGNDSTQPSNWRKQKRDVKLAAFAEGIFQPCLLLRCPSRIANGRVYVQFTWPSWCSFGERFLVDTHWLWNTGCGPMGFDVLDLRRIDKNKSNITHLFHVLFACPSTINIFTSQFCTVLLHMENCQIEPRPTELKYSPVVVYFSIWNCL